MRGLYLCRQFGDFHGLFFRVTFVIGLCGYLIAFAVFFDGDDKRCLEVVEAQRVKLNQDGRVAVDGYVAHMADVIVRIGQPERVDNLDEVVL